MVRKLMTWNEKSKRWFKKYKKRQYTVSCKTLGAPATKEGSVKAANRWWRRKKMEIDNKRQTVRRYQADWEYIIALCRAKAARLSTHRPGTTFLLEHGETLYKRMVAVISEMPKRLQLRYAERAEKRIEKLRRIVPEITDDHPECRKELLELADFLQQEIDRGGQLSDPKPLIVQFPEVFGVDDEWLGRLVYTTSETPAHASTIGAQVDRWLKMEAARIQVGEIGRDRYSAYHNAITSFLEWAGINRHVEEITGELLESYRLHLLDRIAERAMNADAGMTPEYAEEQMNTTKQFLKWLRRQDLIPHLTILNDRNALRIKRKRRGKTANGTPGTG